MPIKVRKLTENLGVEILDLDLSKTLDKKTIKEIE